MVSIRYMIDDVPAAIKFYTTHLGFSLRHGCQSGVRIGQS
jgi:catechol 2,3-dioxygenase-like lactoylglutathione lyase family enzyme